jgi:CDP-diacylglycerol--glycerol-3-phosphate 3-phosphatidyltransferase
VARGSIYALKPAFQALLRPASRALVRAGATPNQVTLAAAVLSVAAGAFVAARPHDVRSLLVLPGVLLVRMALNALDGMMAREHGLATPLGALLNELGDVVADAVLYLPLALVPGFPPALVVAVVLLGVIAEMSGVVAVQIGGARRYDGPMGKSDRAFVIGALGLLVGLGVPRGSWIDVVLAVVVGLAVLTVLNRARKGLREAAR